MIQCTKCNLQYIGETKRRLKDRFNELANIQPNHIFFHEDFVKVFVRRSKTDVYREGNYVYISKLDSNYSPVTVLCRYIQAADIDLSSQLPLFRP